MPNDIFKKTALWVIKIGLFIVPFIPLYISRVLFFPYITGKAFLFRTIVEIIFAAWVFLAAFWPEYRPKRSALTVAMGFFVLAVALASIFAANPSRALWSNFERMEGMLAYLHLAAYFLVLAHVLKQREWFWFLSVFVLVGFVENFYALFQRLGYLASPQGGFRVDGTIGNPTYLAAYLTFVFFFALFLWQSARNFPLKLYYGAAALFSLAVIYFTATRGAALGLLGAGTAALVLYFIFEKKGLPLRASSYKKAAASLLLALILLPVSVWYFRDSSFVAQNPVLSRFASISFSERTVASRFLIWKLAFNGFKERPFLGWGPENFNLVFAKHYEPGLYEQEPWFDRSHNIVFDWLINGGLVGFLAYFGLIFAAVFTLWNLYLKGVFPLGPVLIFSALIMAYLFQNFFVFDQLATYLGFFTLLAFLESPARAGGSAGAATQENVRKRPALDYESLVAVVLVFAALASVYFLNFRPYLANRNLLSAMQAHAAGDFTGALERYERALSLSVLGRQEVRENFARFAVMAGQNANLPQDFRIKVFTRALEDGRKSVQENSGDPRSYLFLASLYRAGNSNKEALSTLEKAKFLIPAKQQVYFEIADLHVAEGNFGKAAEELKTAFELVPEFSEARINLAAIYVLEGRQAEADKLLMDGFGKLEMPRIILVQVYYRVKNYERMIGIWKAFTETDPRNLEYRRSLAGSYLLAARRLEAVQTLQEAMEDFPEFRAEGEALIKDILSSP